MNLYTYKGSVKEFDMIINPNWEGSTFAVSEKRARSNLIYQYKVQHGLKPGAKISLPGKIVMKEYTRKG